MVRKRSRKYESDDNDSDSDVDFEVEPRSRPAAKKYSLRERKAPLLTDFDYYGLDDEEEARKMSSDDEDFQVEADADGEVARSYFEPDAQVEPQNSEGLIDFEDIIRADIVVNKNKIDYDNIIQKTEIKLTEPQPKRRGRKPKSLSEEKSAAKKDEEEEEEVESETKFVCEPDIAALEQIEPIESDETKKDEEKKSEESEKHEALPNGVTLEHLENGDTEMGTAKDTAAAAASTKIEMVMVEPPPPQPDEEQAKIEEEDDDVIVLGELKHDVIVLDD